jgi:hypothetical protein
MLSYKNFYRKDGVIMFLRNAGTHMRTKISNNAEHQIWRQCANPAEHEAKIVSLRGRPQKRFTGMWHKYAGLYFR